LNVVKNNLGVKGKVRIPSDLAHLQFVDKKHANQSFHEEIAI